MNTNKRTVAIVMMAVFALGLTTCKKEKIEVPTVKVFEGAITINYTKASVSAEVTDQGGGEVRSRGFAYGATGGAMDTIFCGSGTGVFSAELNNLQPNTSYVYEAFAKNVGGFGTSGKVTFTSKDNEKPTVKTNEVSDEGVTTTTASVSGNVTDDGGAQVTERGVCWSTSHTPTLNDSHLPAGNDLGEFTCDLTNLSPNTKYYACAYAKNSKGTTYGNEISFTTKPLQTYTIGVSSNPNNGGTVTGGGTFDEGQSCSVKATANTGFNFVKWIENDEQVSTHSEYTFDVTSNRNLVAHFTAQAYTIIATPEPENGGTVSGSGGYNYGDHCSLTATAKPGFTFTKWTENGNQVSTNATYSFEVTGNRELIAHFTLKTYTITATAEPAEGGTVLVSGNGQFHYGDQCTLTATPKPNYNFVNWTKNGTQVSTQATFPIEVTESVEYVAHFQLPGLNLTVSANPTVIAQGNSSQLNAVASGGNGSFTYSWSPTTGLNNANIQNPTAAPTTTKTYTCTVTSGSQTANGTCTVTVVCPPTNLSATVQNGNNVYLSWTAAIPATSYKIYRGNTLIQSNVTTTHYTDSNLNPGAYTYRVSTVYNNVESPKSNSASAIVAPQAPTGAINGLFSVSSTQQVWFSQGNLQYRASTNTWRFATNQWDYVGGTDSDDGNHYGNVSGSSNNNISSYYSGWIDLFGWATSGYNHGAVCYQPWSTSMDYYNYYAYGYPTYNLYDQTGRADWGYNAISNGGNQINQWRTLKNNEWYYIFHARYTPSGTRYAKAIVNSVKGVILLPDDWNDSYYSLNNKNLGDVPYSSNVITSSVWSSAFQTNGAVFLPAAGRRMNENQYWGPSDMNSGNYYSASYYDEDCVYTVWFRDDLVNGSAYSTGPERAFGYSVRLVHDY